jgi:hypothetical protein
VDEEVLTFLTQVLRLESQVRDVSRLLAKLEADFLRALNELASARFEEYR